MPMRAQEYLDLLKDPNFGFADFPPDWIRLKIVRQEYSRRMIEHQKRDKEASCPQPQDPQP